MTKQDAPDSSHPADSLELVRSILDHVSDVVWASSVDGNVLLFLNRAGENLYGLKVAPGSLVETRQRPIHIEDRTLVRRNLANVLEEKTLKNEKGLIKISTPAWFKKQVGFYPDYGSYCEMIL